MENIYYIRALNSEHQMLMLPDLTALLQEQQGIVKLVIIDSVMALFRVCTHALCISFVPVCPICKCTRACIVRPTHPCVSYYPAAWVLDGISTHNTGGCNTCTAKQGLHMHIQYTTVRCWYM